MIDLMPMPSSRAAAGRIFLTNSSFFNSRGGFPPSRKFRHWARAIFDRQLFLRPKATHHKSFERHVFESFSLAKPTVLTIDKLVII
jgi:hypothetical protein